MTSECIEVIILNLLKVKQYQFNNFKLHLEDKDFQLCSLLNGSLEFFVHLHI